MSDLYQSKKITIRARQWVASEAFEIEDAANEIMAWVNANGGEARYDPPSQPTSRKVHPQSLDGLIPARIAVRTINGWAYASSGHYIIMGDATFDVWAKDHSPETDYKTIRDFYPCDPATFDKRWEPAS